MNMATTKVAKKFLIDAAGIAIGTEGAGEPAGVQFVFSDESKQALMLANLQPGIVVRLALHGAGQKIGDSYASAAKADDPVAYAKEAAKDVIAQLVTGEWRAASAPGAAKVTLLARALARLTGETPEKTQEIVDSLTKEQTAEYKSKKKVVKAMEAIRAEDAAALAARLAKKAAASTEDEDEEEDDITLPELPADADEE
jgi:hypothetical protein